MIENVEVMNPGTLLWTTGCEDEIVSLDQVPPELGVKGGRPKYPPDPLIPDILTVDVNHAGDYY